jgi:hypothetical protein
MDSRLLENDIVNLPSVLINAAPDSENEDIAPADSTISENALWLRGRCGVLAAEPLNANTSRNRKAVANLS